MPKKASKTRPQLLLDLSDIHAGGSTALCPPKVLLDDGGSYTASKGQSWLWEQFGDMCERTRQKVAELHADLFLILNGDLVDGYHHGTTELLSANPNAQAAVVNACMQKLLALNPKHILVARGTEAHVGKSASAEERIADGLRRDGWPVIVDPDTGTSSWWHFRGDIQGVYVDVTHHGRTGQREHTRGSAAVLHAHDIFLSHAKRGDRHPDLCLRGHHHKFNDSYDSCPTRVITSGAWQFATSYVHKVAADSVADIGGYHITIEAGEYEVERIEYRPSRGTIWTPNTEKP